MDESLYSLAGAATPTITTNKKEEEEKKEVSTICLMDGPYGCLSIDTTNTTKLLLLAGGIGLTPSLSILTALRDRASSTFPSLEQVQLVWVSRDYDTVHSFTSLLLDLHSSFVGNNRHDEESGGSGGGTVSAKNVYYYDEKGSPLPVAIELTNRSDATTPVAPPLPHPPPPHGGGNTGFALGLSVRIYVTQPKGGGGSSSTIPQPLTIIKSRPDLNAIFNSFFPPNDPHHSRHYAVFACGPESLLQDAQRHSHKRGIAIHMEEFSW